MIVVTQTVQQNMEKNKKRKSNVRRNHTFRFVEYELAVLEEEAKFAGMNKSKYVRELCPEGGANETFIYSLRTS